MFLFDEHPKRGVWSVLFFGVLGLFGNVGYHVKICDIPYGFVVNPYYCF